MKKFFTCLILLSLLTSAAVAQNMIFRTSVNNVDLIVDGTLFKEGWRVAPEINPDVFETTAREVVFISDVDTLVINNLREWESFDFDIITNAADTSHVRVTRTAINIFENPTPQLLKKAPSGNLTREQASFDIDALIYALSQVHPNMYSVCRQEDLLRAVNKAKASLTDSVTPLQLYLATAPIVAMIGDGHTNMWFPYNSLFTRELKRRPVYVRVQPDRSLICKSSLDSIIPRGAKVLSINNISADSLINSMMPYVSGEKTHFKLSKIDNLFDALFQMLYAADEYTVQYQLAGSRKVLSHVFPATTWDEIKKRCPSTRSGKKYERYSYTVDSLNNVAVMDFREFSDIKGMEIFADSMFRELNNKGIGNLIIDVRNNGGGNSGVGDVLLRYISPEPFIQLEKMLVRVTPLTSKLMGTSGSRPMLILQEFDSTQFTHPRSIEEGHYTGHVYLLTSNRTFSSASSFAWAFKECGMGKVIGEETGGVNVCYGDVLSYQLPISGLSMSISYKRFWQLRADENDIHGTLPDVEVPEEKALDTALKLIRKSKK